MSLFPAYSKDAATSSQVKSNEHTPKVRGTGELPWLRDVDVVCQGVAHQGSRAAQSEERAQDTESIYLSSDTEKYESEPHTGSEPDAPPKKKRRHKDYHKEKKHPKRKKKKKHRQRDGSPPSVNECQIKSDDFYEDKLPNKGFLKVATLHRPATPIYTRGLHRVIGRLQRSAAYKSRKKSYRYYTYPLEDENAKTEKEKGASSCEKEENEITRRTEEFNVALAKEQNNIDMWLQYVDYQDVIYQFEHSYRGAHGKQATAERQLSIIDRALSLNPGNKHLVRKRVTIAESSLSADVASRQIEALLSTQPTSIELWRGFVRTTQCSMALCSAPGVLNLYIRATQQLHQSRRGAPASQTPPAERAIVDLVLDCGLFLRQAGLWEHVWVLVQAYLTLNLITPTTKYFELKSDISEDDVMTEEMKVVRSQLPLMTLWTRVERIREDAHWLPLPDDEQSEDPQRHITGEDIAELVHPITEPGLSFRLVAVCVALLKVPLLPFRDCWVRLLGVDRVPWAVDGPEWFLPVLQTPSPLWKPPSANIILSVLPLVGGPQYLHATLGQPLYLNAVSKVLRLVSEVVPEPASTAFLIWWLRFERLMLSLERSKICKLPPSHRKIRSTVKEILKQERYRNNLSLYHEFALLELDLGHSDAAQRILSSAAQAAFPGVPVAGVPDSVARAALVALYRSLCEIHLSRGDEAGALQVLLTLVSNRGSDARLSIEEATSKFLHIGTELLNDASSGDADGSEILLPDAVVEWFTCHGWLISLTDSLWTGVALFEKLVSTFEVSEESVTKERCRAEAFWESYVCMVQWQCSNSSATFSLLQDTLTRAVRLFPNNLHFLASLSGLQNIASTVSSVWCHLTNFFSSSESVLPQLFLVLDSLHRHSELKEARERAQQFLCVAGPVVTDPCEQNRCLSVLERLLRNQSTKHCPLLWRLKLKMHPSEGTFYRAADECPWVRDLYLDGTLCVPDKADKLQALLMEKELRYHVLPDELQVIRSGFEALAAMCST